MKSMNTRSMNFKTSYYQKFSNDLDEYVYTWQPHVADEEVESA